MVSNNISENGLQLVQACLGLLPSCTVREGIKDVVFIELISEIISISYNSCLAES